MFGLNRVRFEELTDLVGLDVELLGEAADVIAVARHPLTAGLATRMVRQMVNYQHHDLDRVFAALVDPTRRAILARLEQAESLTISAIAEPFAIKLPAVMKHLDVLGDAGLITREKHGRTVDVRLAPEPLREATEWLRRYERFWSTALDRLTAYAERNEAEAKARGE